MTDIQPIELHLLDTEWPFTYIDHQRATARAIVFDDAGFFYFVHTRRDDEFGRADHIETPGGGVEAQEDLCAAITRELREELGAEVEILCRLGTVNDRYNLLHRHNINNYFLCRAVSFGERHLTPDEAQRFHLSVLRLPFSQAVETYERYACTGIGRLIANRELPVLRHAQAVLCAMKADA